MAKPICRYIAKLQEISPLQNVNVDNWAWRLQYIRIEDVLHVMESEHKYIGKNFLIIIGYNITPK
ncbi:MAG: hypothetical protein IJX55_11370 [Clostridia bacterium]|jgi:hypothetical protein|nr:hypothetical protein [Clostridia bacterium]